MGKTKRWLSLIAVFILIFTNVSAEELIGDFDIGQLDIDELEESEVEMMEVRDMNQDEMMQLKERMERKNALSYEHGGFGNYYTGPSYEGYSKEHMVFGMIFKYIGDEIDMREIKEYCANTEKVADIVLSRFREKAGDLQNVCKEVEEQEKNCEEISRKGCAMMGSPAVMMGSNELEKLHSAAYSCPVNKDSIISACKVRSKYLIEDKMKRIEEHCRQRFDFEGERLEKECDKFLQHQICDKEKFINQCLGMKKDNGRGQVRSGYVHAKWSCYDGFTESRSDDSCKSADEWESYARKSCEGRCYPEKEKCGINSFNVDGECKSSSGDTKENVACTQDAKQCPDGTYVSRIPPKCGFAPCPERKCPTLEIPQCAQGTIMDKKEDSNGCIYYYCRHIECPEVSKPSCSDGQSMIAKYDERKCIVAYECISTTATSNVILITGNPIVENGDDFENYCRRSWNNQERICAELKGKCGKGSFESCVEQEKINSEQYLLKVVENCERESSYELKYAEQKCARIEKDREACMQQSKKRCQFMQGLEQQCRETMTEENIREFIVREAKKRCKFAGIIEDDDEIIRAERVEIILAVLNTATQDDLKELELYVEDLKEQLKLQDTTVYKGWTDPKSFGDIKLIPFVVNAKISTAQSSAASKEVKTKIVARQKAEESASKLVSLRDSDVPDEYLYIIEDKASDVLEAGETIEEIEKKEGEKSFGYKMKLFFGLAKKAEQQEVAQLEEGKKKLNSSIETLSKLVDEIPSDVAKAVLQEQIGSLKQQQEEIDSLIKSKERKSKGLFGIFG